jgi:hypothetical protein
MSSPADKQITCTQHSQIARKSNIFDTSVYHSKNANMVKPLSQHEGARQKWITCSQV